MTIVFQTVREFQAVLNWRGPVFDSGGGATVLGFQSPPGGTLEEAAELIYNEAVAEILPGVHEAVTLASVYCRNATLSTEFGAGEAGDRTGPIAPPNTAVLLSYNTARIGRRGRGRSYWPGLLNDGDVLDNGTISSGRLTEIQAYMDTFFQHLVDESYDQIVLQNLEGKTPPLGPPSPAVTARLLRSRAATQRRRLRR